MEKISWEDFLKVDMRLGKILRVEDFPKARKPAYQLWIDFGDDYGVRKTSAQITDRYTKDSLVGMLVICVVNFPPKQIADFMSEVLVMGFPDEEGKISLATIDGTVPLGARLC